MFATLRYDADNVEVTSTQPAHVQRKRYACRNCHSKKLRCTRGQHGCRQCLSKGLKCEYERDSHRRSRRSNGTVNQSQAEFSSSTNTPAEDNPHYVTTHAQLESPLSMALVTPATASSLNTSAESNGVFDFVSYNLSDPIREFTAYDAVSISNGAGNHNHYEFTVRTATTDPIAEATPPLREPILSFESTSTPITTPPLPPSTTRSLTTEPRSNTCQCDATAITLLEIVSVEHVEATLQSVPKVLGHGKDTLNRCKELLRCNLCSNRSGFLTLLVTICQKLTLVYQRTIVILTDQFFKLHAPHLRDEAYIAQLQARRDAAAQALGRSLNVRDYDVDVEEEPCVFGGVVQMQLKKMVVFLGILKTVLVASNWSSHLVMVQMVRDQVQELLAKCSTRCAGVDCDIAP